MRVVILKDQCMKIPHILELVLRDYNREKIYIERRKPLIQQQDRRTPEVFLVEYLV